MDKHFNDGGGVNSLTGRAMQCINQLKVRVVAIDAGVERRGTAMRQRIRVDS